MAGKQPPLEIRVPVVFDLFYRHAYAPVVTLSYALCGDRVTAEQLGQEAFSRARREWNSVGRLDSPEQWMRQTTMRLTASPIAARRSRVARRLGLTTTSNTVAAVVDADCESFWREVRALPRRQREVVTLVSLDGETTRAISQTLGISEAEVRAALDDGRQRLVERFRAIEPDSPATYDERAAAAASALKASARSGQPPDLDTVAQTQRRVAMVAAALGVSAAVVLLAGLLALVSVVGGDTSAEPSTVPPDDELVMPAELTVAHDNSRYDYTIRFPSRWTTAPEHLSAGDPEWEEVFAAGTALYSQGTWTCSERAPAAMQALSGDNLLLVLQERTVYAPGGFPTVDTFDATAGDPITFEADCFVGGATGGGIEFESAGRGFVAWWGFGPLATSADRSEVWAVLESFAPEVNPTAVASAAAYESTGACGIANLPAGWQDEAFRVGPLYLWAASPPAAGDGGDVWTRTVAVVQGREAVTIRVASGAEELAAHLFGVDTSDGEPLVVARGRTAVTFLPCSDTPAQHLGGFIAAPGVECVPWDVRVGNEVSLRSIIPVLGGDCSPGSTTEAEDAAQSSAEAAATLYMTNDTTLTIVDVDSAEFLSRRVETLAPGDPAYRLLRRGDHLVYYGIGGDPGEASATYAAPLSGLESQERLGPGWFIPAAEYENVWLVDQTAKTFSEVSIDGEIIRTVQSQTTGWPVGAIDEGLLFQQEEQIVVWDPDTADVVASVTGPFPIAFGGSRIVSCSDCSRRVVFTNLEDGGSRQERGSDLPPGIASIHGYGGALSPAGSTVATIGLGLDGPVGQQATSVHLVLFDWESGAAVVVPGADFGAWDYPKVAWNRDGSWAFISNGSEIRAFHPGDSSAVTVDVELTETFYAMVAG